MILCATRKSGTLTPPLPPNPCHTDGIRGKRVTHSLIFPEMFNSTRLAVLFNNPTDLASILVKNPKKIGPRRATILFHLAAHSNTKHERKLGRDALKQCAKVVGRHVNFDGSISDRVFNKASNARLMNWAQDKNTNV